MRDIELYKAILGLTLPWTVANAGGLSPETAKLLKTVLAEISNS